MSKSKSIIIEFVGPPGAGKTTSCRCFSELLHAKGLKVCTLQDIKDYVKEMNIAKKSFLLLKFIFFRSILLIFFSALLAYNRIYSVHSIYRFMRLTIFDLALNQYVRNKRIDVVLLEQWIIQELWSATIFKLKSYKSIARHLPRFYFKTDAVIYFNIDVATASERIEFRNTNLSRFDRMDAKQRLLELFKYNSYLYDLYQKSECSVKHQFSAHEHPEKNAQLFVQHLNKQFQFI